LFILALLSKPMAVSLPLILILFEYYKQRTFDVKYYLGKLWPYFVLCFIAIIIMLIPGGAGRVLKYNSLIVVIHNVYWYFQQTLFPIELNPAYPLVRQASSAMGMVLFYLGVALLLIFILIKKKSHFFINMMLIMFGYLASLLPVVGLIAVGNMEYYDRFSYIPSVFIWFGLGLILSKKLYPDDAYYSALNEKRKKNILLFRKIAVLILIIYSFVLIIINYNYQKIWETPYSLFLYSANCTPASELAVNKLADYELGRRNYKKVWEISEKIDQKAGGKSVMGMYFRGSVKYHLDKKTAIPLLLAIKPYFKAYANDRYSEGRIRYIKILEMLIDSYNSSGDQQEANKYINERQGLP